MENLTDEEVIQLIDAKHIRSHALEKVLNNPLRGVEVRRKFVMKQSHVKNKNLDSVPYKDYDYEQVSGACAENVIGNLVWDRKFFKKALAKKPREKSRKKTDPISRKKKLFWGDILYANLFHVISRVFSPELLLLLITHN